MAQGWSVRYKSGLKISCFVQVLVNMSKGMLHLKTIGHAVIEKLIIFVINTCKLNTGSDVAFLSSVKLVPYSQ